MNYDEFLRRVPKAELHCHVEGSIRPETAFDLARKNRVELPAANPDGLYRFEGFGEFAEIAVAVSSTLVDRDDFARIAFESLEDGVELGNLRYREMFFTPTLHTSRGVAYPTVVDGLCEGIREAERRLGVRCRLIPDIQRQDPPAVAVEVVRQVLAHRPDEVIGLGLDGAEAIDPPEQFVEAYRLARQGGLRLTAHACEDAPPVNITTCLDLLGCERIDHGYYVLDDERVLARARDEGIVFTVAPTATAICYFTADLAAHPIRAMVEQGLSVVLNTDDPPMFATDLGSEYALMCTAAGWGPDQVRQLCLNGVDGAWLDDDERRDLRRSFERELDELEAQLDPDSGAPGS